MSCDTAASYALDQRHAAPATKERDREDVPAAHAERARIAACPRTRSWIGRHKGWQMITSWLGCCRAHAL